MSEQVLDPTPGLGAVAAAQIRAVGQAVRREILVVAILFWAVHLLAILYVMSRGESIELGHLGGYGIPAGLAAFLFPVAVWKGEERFGMSTLWTLPVDHARHALVKVFAGWSWIMVLTLGFVLSVVLGVLISGGPLGEEVTRLVADASDPSGARTVEWSRPWWQWLVPFAAASTGYLLGSALVLAADHPWRWILGALLCFWILGFFGEEVEIEWMATIFEGLIFDIGFSRYGVDAFLTGGSESNQTRLTLASGESVVAWREIPSMTRWALSVLLWSAIGIAGMLAATWRHRER